jgi:hypothetical protein
LEYIVLVSQFHILLGIFIILGDIFGPPFSFGELDLNLPLRFENHENLSLDWNWTIYQGLLMNFHGVLLPGDPGLNVLANHGILPHFGIGITRDVLVKALTSTYNVDSSLAGFLFDQAALRLGFSVLDFSILNKHGVVEHDASLTRKDYGDARNDCVSPQQNRVNQFKAFAVNGKLDIYWSFQGEIAENSTRKGN